MSLDPSTGLTTNVLKTAIKIDTSSLENWTEGAPLTVLEEVTNREKYRIVKLDGKSSTPLQEFNLEHVLGDESLYELNLLDENHVAIQSTAVKSYLVNTRIFAPGTKKIIATLAGFGLKKMGSNYLILRQEGTNEHVPYLLDSNFNTVRKLGLKDKYGVYRCKPYEEKIVCKFSSNFMHSRIFEFDAKNNSEEIFATNSIGDDVVGQRFVFTSTEDYKLPAYFFNVPTQRPKGVVIYVHGGGCHDNFRFGIDRFDPTFLAIVRMGYGLVGINYRNDVSFSPHHGPKRWPKEKCGTQEIDDILAARELVTKKFPALPVFLYGHSQGGYLVNLVATKHAHRARWNGIISSAGLWLPSPLPSNLVKSYNPENFPISFIGNLDTPFLLFHGKADENVDFIHAQKFLEGVGYQNDSDKIKAFTPDYEVHNIDDFRNHQIWLEKIRQFLEENS